MISFMCIEIKADGSKRGLYTRSFHAAPAVGDFISMSDADGIGMHYEVISRGWLSKPPAICSFRLLVTTTI